MCPLSLDPQAQDQRRSLDHQVRYDVRPWRYQGLWKAGTLAISKWTQRDQSGTGCWARHRAWVVDQVDVVVVTPADQVAVAVVVGVDQ